MCVEMRRLDEGECSLSQTLDLDPSKPHRLRFVACTRETNDGASVLVYLDGDVLVLETGSLPAEWCEYSIVFQPPNAEPTLSIVAPHMPFATFLSPVVYVTNVNVQEVE